MFAFELYLLLILDCVRNDCFEKSVFDDFGAPLNLRPSKMECLWLWVFSKNFLWICHLEICHIRPSSILKKVLQFPPCLPLWLTFCTVNGALQIANCGRLAFNMTDLPCFPTGNLLEDLHLPSYHWSNCLGFKICSRYLSTLLTLILCLTDERMKRGIGGWKGNKEKFCLQRLQAGY